MAAVVVRNQGKTEFVKGVLADNPLANAEAVNEAWLAAGRPGTISETLVYKVRSAQGLAGNLRGHRGTRSATEAAVRTRKRRGRKPRSAAPSRAPARAAQATARSSRAVSVGRNRLLADIEAEIDRLLFKVMDFGRLPEIEESLRRTRRLLYGAHA
jgi:hypothetical protein